MAKLVSILGSVTPPGRFLKAMNAMTEAARAANASLEARLINLADCRIAFADGRPAADYNDDTAEVLAQVEGADAVILATPVYRGTMTGALKNLLDHLPIEALRGKPCGIVAMGATNHHYLGVDWHLREVLAWFGAFTAPTGVYLTSADFSDGEVAQAAREELLSLVQMMLKMREIAPRNAPSLGPVPLAARAR